MSNCNAVDGIRYRVVENGNSKQVELSVADLMASEQLELVAAAHADSVRYFDPTPEHPDSYSFADGYFVLFGNEDGWVCVAELNRMRTADATEAIRAAARIIGKAERAQPCAMADALRPSDL